MGPMWHTLRYVCNVCMRHQEAAHRTTAYQGRVLGHTSHIFERIIRGLKGGAVLKEAATRMWAIYIRMQVTDKQVSGSCTHPGQS